MLRRIVLGSAMLGGCASPPPAAGMAASPTTAREALGRRILSTAFVRLGPEGRMVIGLRDGRTLTLRGVTMEPKGYCGTAVPTGARRCGRYADVVAARAEGRPDAPAAIDPLDGRIARPRRD